MYQLCPSILSADFNRLGEQIKILEKEGVSGSTLTLWMGISFQAFLSECL